MKITRDKFQKYRGRIARELLIRAYSSCYQRTPLRRVVQRFHRAKYPEKWVFIIGCYNSGTTLLQRLISAHPNVSTLPREGVRLTSELSRPEDYGWTRMWARCLDKIALPPEEEPGKASRVVRDWSPFFDKRCDVFLEKSIANLPRMGWLDVNFENAFFIGIIRNPYAVSASIRRKARPRPPVSQQFSECYPIRLPAHQWFMANALMTEQQRTVKRFRKYKYEDIVSDPVMILTDIFNFLEEPVPPMIYQESSITVSGFSESIENMNDRSIEELSEEDVGEINAEIGSEICGFGYNLMGKHENRVSVE